MKKYKHSPAINARLIRDAFGQDFLGQSDGTQGVLYGYAYCRIETLGVAGETADLSVLNREATDLRDQLAAIHQAAAEKNIHIPADSVYVDVGLGDDVERPALHVLMDKVREPKSMVEGGILVISEASRLAKKDWQIGYLQEYFRNCRTNILYVAEKIVI